MIKQTVLAFGMMALAGTALATQTQADVDGSADIPVGQRFAALDDDDNARIDWSEAKNDIPRAAFDSADANGDGVLSKSEYKTLESQ